MLTTYALLIMIAITMPLCAGAVSLGGDKNRRVGGTDNSAARFMVFLVFLVLAIAIGFRTIVGAVNDEYAYRNRIIAMAGKTLAQAMKGSSEPLDVLSNWVMAKCFPGESQWLFVIYSVETYSCFVYSIYKFCDNFEFGILLLFLLNIINVSFNTAQQITAVGISMIGIPFVYQKKFWKYLAVVVVAALMHNSAIMLIGVYFIANMKPWSGKFIGVAALFVVIMATFNTIMPNLLGNMEAFEGYEDSYGDGVRMITVVVAFVPIIMAYVFKSRLPDDDEQMRCGINTALIYAMIYLVSTQNKYVARFGMYLQPFVIVFYTRAMTYLKKENLSNIIYFALIAGYGATFIYFTKETTYKFISPLNYI